MDLMSILGWLLMIGTVIFGIMFDSKTVSFIPDNIGNFWDPSSVAVVLGGVITALMVSFPISIFGKIPRHLKIIFAPKKYNPQKYIDEVVELAEEARSNGLLSLEAKLEETKDEFLKNGMMLVVDAVDAEKVRSILEKELEYLDDRQAFGMVGTLMGLINMLKQLSDPDAIAPAMALALVTTFYGSILSNGIFLPISNKLKIRHEEEYLCKMIVMEGIQGIQAGDAPRFLREKLEQLIPGYIVKKGSKGKGGGEAADGKKGK